MSDKTKTLTTSVTSRDPKGLKATSIFADAYNSLKLDDERAQRLNEHPDFSLGLKQLITKCSASNQYASEETASNYTYPEGYEILPIEEQIKKIAEIFGLNPTEALEYAKNLPKLPEGAEGWFAIPRWDKVASTYNQAVETALAKFGESRKFYNYRKGELGEKYLRQSQRSLDMWDKLYEQQPGDIIIVPAQFGLRHRGKSVRRARETFSINEFGLGVFATTCMLLTHPTRLKVWEQLHWDCAGDEYNWDVGGGWSGCPYFGFDDDGVEFGASRVEGVGQGFGSASAFLFGSVLEA